MKLPKQLQKRNKPKVQLCQLCQKKLKAGNLRAVNMEKIAQNIREVYCMDCFKILEAANPEKAKVPSPRVEAKGGYSDDDHLHLHDEDENED